MCQLHDTSSTGEGRRKHRKQKRRVRIKRTSTLIVPFTPQKKSETNMTKRFENMDVSALLTLG